MSTINASIILLKDIPFSKLEIPSYQRPYKWNENNVIQLLRDIDNNLNKSEYRIGSIILHKTATSLNIVDGQQRLTTLVLLMKVLGLDYKQFHVLYAHVESQHNIKKNYATIVNWCETHLSDTHRTSYIDFLWNRCSFVWIEVDEISEAFQMFDSQNGRGKELKAYNLLKAFHLRAMDKGNTRVELTDEKIAYDQLWEAYSSQHQGEDFLAILTEIIYRIRLWSRRKEAYHFDKSKLKEFKGIQIEETSYPCQNFAKMIYATLYGKTDGNDLELIQPNNAYTATARALMQGINTPIINGAPFFEFILAQVKNYQTLFLDEVKDERLVEFRKDYHQYCQYDGYQGTGNTYIRTLYKAFILLIYDKFGSEGVKEMYPTLYLLAYRLRLIYKQVRFTTVAQYPVDIFETIQSSWSLDNLISLESRARQQVGLRLYNNQVQAILPFFNNRKIPVYAEENLNNGEIIKGETLQENGEFK